ncbi:DUF4160 domain-containing protein [Nitratifractor sp.]|uniref:DUF4160 domain-containing protein n=1 Tax=Nitratifractor sp. TaxID=2268144 RepID=UPI00345D106E
MPTVLRREGFRFFFYSDEHAPSHIHVEKGEAYARIELDSLKVTDTYRLSSRDLKKILLIVREYRDYLQEAWNEHFQNHDVD